ncbi:MAG: hypothetical protein E7378_04350 [Clostridiales bacterium]|nr:hypothetical protein [Clostridiales bacterium]
MIVSKFGGSSVASLQTANKIKQIVAGNQNIKFVVVSALGKSEIWKDKITDLLFRLFFLIAENKEYMFLVDEIFNRYEHLSRHLGVCINWHSYKQEFLKQLQDIATKEYIVSRGEYLSAILYSKFLCFDFLDAKDYIIFNKNNSINYKATCGQLAKLPANNRYVIGGYYGATKGGNIKVFERGGSDITGAIIAKLLKAEIYQNFTDVDGVYNKPPNLFKDATGIPLLNFSTAIAMASCGTEVVHQKALEELNGTNTILFVKSTLFPQNFGSIILKEEYKNNKIFVCCSNINLIICQNLTPKLKKQICSKCEVKKIIKNNGKYYIICNSLFVDEKYFYALGCKVLADCCQFIIFSFLKFDKNITKKLKKMQKKLKKYAFFNNFTAFFNNFLIICKKEQKQKVVQILNKIKL